MSRLKERSGTGSMNWLDLMIRLDLIRSFVHSYYAFAALSITVTYKVLTCGWFAVIESGFSAWQQHKSIGGAFKEFPIDKNRLFSDCNQSNETLLICWLCTYILKFTQHIYLFCLNTINKPKPLRNMKIGFYFKIFFYKFYQSFCTFRLQKMYWHTLDNCNVGY